MGLVALLKKTHHHVNIAIMTLRDQINRNGARPVGICQAGAVPGSVPQRSPPKQLEVSLSSCGARGRGGKVTGRKPSKTKEAPAINIMQWNAEGVSNKTTELQHFLHANNINVCCIQETNLQEGSHRRSVAIRCSEVIDR